MKKPDLKTLAEIGKEALELQAAGLWTLEAWERLVKKAEVAADGFSELVGPIFKQKPGGLTRTIRDDGTLVLS